MQYRVLMSLTTACTVAAFVPAGSHSKLADSKVSSTCAPKTQHHISMISVEEEKEVVKNYFNTEGFNRWNRIYSEDGEVNSVQLDIRNGHQVTVDKILAWIDDDADIADKTVCDAGCGVGSLSIPLAARGAKVSGSDISESMATEAGRRAQSSLGEAAKNAQFKTADLESLDGKYDTVTCIDVMIHYPEEKMAGMVGHLASLADKRLIISFAPKTWFYSALKGIGGLFPGPSKTTRAYLHEEEAVVKALKQAGFEIRRNDMTGTNFYFSRLLEAVRV